MSVPVRVLTDRGQCVSGHRKFDLTGLAVATFPAFDYSYFEEDLQAAGTNEMAVNGTSTGGAVLNVHDGTGLQDAGTPDWPMSGSVWTESALAARSGTNGLQTPIGWANKTFFDRGISFSANTYSVLNLWINVQSRSVDSDIRISFEDSTASNVGVKLNISNYITWSVGAWIFVSIPIADFLLGRPIQRIEVDPRGGPQSLWIDDITFASAAGAALGPQAYTVCAPVGTERYVKGLRVTLVAPSLGWQHDTFAHLLGLQAGLLLRVSNYRTQELYFQSNMQDNVDMFTRFTAEDVITFLSTGRLVTFYSEFPTPMLLRDATCLGIVVRDDLSSLLRLQARVFGGQRSIARNEEVVDHNE